VIQVGTRFGTAQFILYRIKEWKCTVFQGVYGKRITLAETRFGKKSQIVGQICQRGFDEKYLEHSVRKLLSKIQIHSPGEPYWAPLDTPMKDRSDTDICRFAVSSSEGNPVWDTRANLHKYVSEAQRRKLSPDQCHLLFVN
jgi:hypothetical protein